MAAEDSSDPVVKKIVQKKIATAALKEAHELNSEFQKERNANFKYAKIGFVLLGLFLLVPFLIELFSEDSDRLIDAFNAKVVDLYEEQNTKESPWFTKVIKVGSREQGVIHVEVSEDLYPLLKIGDEVEVGHYERESSIPYSVKEVIAQNAP